MPLPVQEIGAQVLCFRLYTGAFRSERTSMRVIPPNPIAWPAHPRRYQRQAATPKPLLGACKQRPRAPDRLEDHDLAVNADPNSLAGRRAAAFAAIAIAATLASCATGEVRPMPEAHPTLPNPYPAEWAPLVPSSSPDRCPSLDGRYSDAPDAAVPDDGTDAQRFSAIISQLRGVDGVLGLLLGSKPIGAAEAVLLKRRPDHLRIDFQRAPASAVTVDFAVVAGRELNLFYNGPKHWEAMVRGYECGDTTLAFFEPISERAKPRYTGPFAGLVELLLPDPSKGDIIETDTETVRGELAPGSDGSLVLLTTTVAEHCVTVRGTTIPEGLTTPDIISCKDQLTDNRWIRYPPKGGSGLAAPLPRAPPPKPSTPGPDREASAPVAHAPAADTEAQ